MFAVNGFSDLFRLWLIIFGCGLLVTPLLARIFALFTFLDIKRKLLKKHTIISEYSTPADLHAYELGFLYDNRFSDNELYAAVVEMEQQGLLKISLSGRPDFTISSIELTTPQRKAMTDTQLEVITAIDEAKGNISWKALSGLNSEIAGGQNKFETEVYSDLQSSGWLNEGTFLQTLADKKKTAQIISLVLTIIFFILPLYYIIVFTSQNHFEPGFGQIDRDVSLILLIASFFVAWLFSYAYWHLIAYIYFRSAGLPLGSTAKLRQLWPEIVGFRLFIEVVEWKRLKADPNLSDHAMPYCIAFGLYVTPTYNLK